MKVCPSIMDTQMCIHCESDMGKTSNLRIRLEPELHQQFVQACQSQDVPAAQVLRNFMRDYVESFLSSRQKDLFDSNIQTHYK